jgi:hypothetical protein
VEERPGRNGNLNLAGLGAAKECQAWEAWQEGPIKQQRQRFTNEEAQSMSKYARFGAMIATSTIVMFFLMYLNVYSLDHVYWSETRAYMALVMGATMAMIMLGFMLGMYSNRKMNLGILIGALAVFVLALYLVRSQDTVEDVSWMKAMIPHHSIAILTSERANVVDPRVKKLTDQIISSQRKEIDEMRTLIQELENEKQN